MQAARGYGAPDDGDMYASVERFFSLADLSLDASDPEYFPPGKPYIPDEVRRSSRHHGWTPGLYTKVDDEDDEE